MRFALLFLFLSFITFLDAYAGAWTIEQGTIVATERVLYTFPDENHTNGNLDIASTYNTDNTFKRISNITEVEYGYTDDITVFGKLDLQYIEDALKISAANATTTLDTELNLNYVQADTKFGIQKRFARDDYQVMSAQLALFPGDLQFDQVGDKTYLKRMKAIEARLLYGRSFQIDNGVFDKSLWNYFEWQAAIKVYPEAHQVESHFDINFGLRPIKGWLFGTGLFNTLNGFIHNNKPYQNDQIDLLVDTSAFTPLQKSRLKDAIKNFTTSDFHYTNHKLQLKVAYDLTPERVIVLEWFTNLFDQRSLRDNSIILSIQKRF